MEEKIYFSNCDGHRLCGLFCDTTTGNYEKTIVICCHGLLSSKDSRTNMQLQKMFTSQQIAILRFDFHGHGESECKFADVTISRAIGDIKQAIAWVKNKGYQHIGLVGSSFGGISSIMIAAQSQDLFALALKSPVCSYHEEEMEGQGLKVQEWKKQGYREIKRNGETFRLGYSFIEDLQKHNGYQVASAIDIPTLIIHGDKDDIVSVEQSKKMASKLPDCHLEILKGVDHYFSQEQDLNKTVDLIVNFITGCRDLPNM